MYFMLKDPDKNKALCEVDIYSKKTESKGYVPHLSVYFYIKNYSNFLLHQSPLDQKRILEDFANIQQYTTELYENTGIYPECKQYLLTDKKLTNACYEIIRITRERLQIIASKYKLILNED